MITKTNLKMNKIKLSSRVVISDPCYKIPTWCQVVLDKVLPGNYMVDVDPINAGVWGTRISMLIAIHEDHLKMNLRWDEYPGVVGVDSGQCGIFSDESYRNDDHFIQMSDGDISLFQREPWIVPNNSPGGDLWYVKMCSRTLGDNQWGHYSEGVVTSSGIGDGSYTLYLSKYRGKIVGMCVDFGIDETPKINFNFYKSKQVCQS